MKLKRILQNNGFILKYYIKYTPLYFFAQLFYCIVVSAVTTLSGPITIKFIFDALANGKPFRQIILFLLLVSACTLFRHIYACYVIEYLQPISNVTLQEKVKAELFEKAKLMDLEYYETPEFYTDLVWAASQADTKISEVFNTLCQFFAYVSEILFLGGVMLAIDPVLFIFAFAAVLIRLIFNQLIIKKWLHIEEKAKPYERERDYSGRIFYLSDYAKEIRMSKIHESLYDKFVTACDQMVSIYQSGAKKIAYLGITSGILQEIFSSFLLSLYLAYQILVTGKLSIGDFSALSSATLRITSRIRYLVNILSDFSQHSLYIEKFRNFLSCEPNIEEKLGKTPSEQCEPIVFKNVSFTYHGESKPSLKNINMTLRPNEKIAIVGYNGAGKSTLIKLLLHLYEPSEGEILMGNTNISDFNTKQYRKQFGAIFQDFQIFAATLGENVGMDFVQTVEETKILEALDKSGFSEKYKELIHGLNTPLTKEFQKTGINFSGGESQKIAIARVFYKPCHYAIMDEPSSALDPISEYKLNQNMMEIAFDKTVLFISHRLSTTIMADCIYMLENGEIVEFGTHEALMQMTGKYAEMFLKQSEKYRA